MVRERKKDKKRTKKNIYIILSQFFKTPKQNVTLKKCLFSSVGTVLGFLNLM